MSTYEILKAELPGLEKKFGSDSYCVRRLKNQPADSDEYIKNNPNWEAEEEEFYATMLKNNSPKRSKPKGGGKPKKD